MKSAILRMIRCGRSTIPTMVSESEEGSRLFRILMEAPKFGRLTVGVSKFMERCRQRCVADETRSRYRSHASTGARSMC